MAGANLATNDQLHLLKPGVQQLTSFTMYTYMCALYTLQGLLVASLLLAHPPLGQARSTWLAYAQARPRRLVRTGRACQPAERHGGG